MLEILEANTGQTGLVTADFFQYHNDLTADMNFESSKFLVPRSWLEET